MSFGIKSFIKPTPNNFRKLGDALLGVGTTITGAGILSDNKLLAIIALIAMIFGKFLTDFFAKE
jgi:hypothetical protein